MTPAQRTGSVIELLERRSLLSVTIGSDGSTYVGKSSDTRVVFVSSSSGRDSNSGLSSSSPVKTLARAKTLVRNGMPDWMLLKKGDTWYEGFGKWRPSGRSSQEPMLISSYGSGARPQLKTGSTHAWSLDGGAIHDVAMIGLHFNAHTRDPESSSFTGTAGTAGLKIVGAAKNLLIENNVIDNYSLNISVTDYNGRHNNLKIRRNVVTDSYAAPTGDSSGIYVDGADGVLIEGNVIDRNGWSKWHSKIYGAQSVPAHNVYLKADTSGVIVRDNIISNGGSHGLQARSGGSITNNLFLNNPIGMSFGLVNGAEAKSGGVSGEVGWNVFLGNRDIATSGRGWGWALEVANVRAGANVRVHHNVFAGDVGKKAGAIQLGTGDPTNKSSTVGINDLIIENNVVYNWYRAIDVSSSLSPGVSGYRNLNNLAVRNNAFQQVLSSKIVQHNATYKSSEERWSGNKYYDADTSSSGWFSIGGRTTSFDGWKSKVESTASKTAVAYENPKRTASTYCAWVGDNASTSTFLAEARKLDSAYTADGLNDYVRDGFDLA